jgi:hypothetical protein
MLSLFHSSDRMEKDNCCIFPLSANLHPSRLNPRPVEPYFLSISICGLPVCSQAYHHNNGSCLCHLYLCLPPWKLRGELWGATSFFDACFGLLPIYQARTNCIFNVDVSKRHVWNYIWLKTWNIWIVVWLALVGHRIIFKNLHWFKKNLSIFQTISNLSARLHSASPHKAQALARWYNYSETAL